MKDGRSFFNKYFVGFAVPGPGVSLDSMRGPGYTISCRSQGVSLPEEVRVLIIGERINSTRKQIRDAILERDTDRIRGEARRQADAGAGYIDANAGIEPDREPDDLAWLTEVIQAEVDCPVCLDSASPAAIRAALAVHEGTPMINSITGEAGRHEEVLPLAREHEARLIALTMGGDGMPRTADDRLDAARQIAELVTGQEIGLDRVYFDPVVCSVATSGEAGHVVLEAIRRLREEFPAAHVTCGLSNISFGLPRRNLLNRSALPMLMAAGVDAAILDPTEPHMRSTVLAGEAILGRDEFCMGYITAEREGRLG
ncbi:MAG: dihydropteroate synthase [Planctomycetota bacterium]